MVEPAQLFVLRDLPLVGGIALCQEAGGQSHYWNQDTEITHMNKSLAALALGCALACSSTASFAGAASPAIPPSQEGQDPRVQGSDVQRQGTDMDKADPATGIRRGMNNVTGGSKDTDLPGGTSTGSGSTGSGSTGSSGSASSSGGAGG